MNRRIRSMIDEIFSRMKMTAENLALRDELLANAQARYEDAVAQGKSEEEAFAEVAASLGDVQALLREMNAKKKKHAGVYIELHDDDDDYDDDDEDEDEDEDIDDEEDDDEDDEDEEEDDEDDDVGDAGTDGAQPQGSVDLGDELNKAFSALGNFGRSIMPQAKKFVRQVDDATGGVILDIGRAVNKGMKDAQKAAGEAIDKLSGSKGEITIDFGKKDAPAQGAAPDKTPEELREEAQDLRAQAGFKQVSGDEEGAREMNAQAEALETQADALEQAQAMADAQRAAEAEAAAQDAPELEVKHEPVVGEDGEVNEDAFTKAVDQIEKDTRKAVGDEDDGRQASAGCTSFPAAGLRGVDIQLDADDVRIVAGEGDRIETIWSAQNVSGEPVVTMEGHTLTIRRRNPDVFKTFFSVFTKDGGELTVRVPHGYAADYKISTTSGDVRVSEVDVETIEVSSTSGDVRVEPDAAVRAKNVKAGTVSGDVTVSACAVDVAVNTVSGDMFVSCDANKVDVQTVSGKVHVEGACEEWGADSVSGEIELVCTIAPTRKIDANTMSGSVRVALPADVRGFVADMSSVSGHITNEFGPNRYGTCALPIHMDTMSGSLIITRL